MNDVRFTRWSARPGGRTDPAGTAGPDLAGLLASCARGDERAFARLYDLTCPRVYGIVARVVRDSAQAVEVTQEVYLQAWRESARYDRAQGSVPAWLCTIAHRRAVDRVRAAAAATAREDRYAARDEDPPYDQTAEQAHASLDAQRVRAVLAELTDAQREAISLAYFAGYTHREVADLLHIPLGTAKTRIRDGLIRLRDALGVNP